MRLLLLISAICVAPAVSAQDLGPLEVRNLRSLSVPFLRISPRPYVLGEGRTEWSFALEAANDVRLKMQNGKTVREDYEIDRLVARYRWGIGRQTDLTVEAPLLTRGGGILDPVIDLWHRYVLHIPNAVRQSAPYGQSLVDIPGHGRYGAASGIGDLTVSIANQPNARLMGIAALKLPTGSDRKLLGSGAFDFGIAAQWLVPLKPRWDLHLQAGYVFQGKSKELPEARKGIFQDAIILEYRHNSRDTAIVQWQGEPSAIRLGVDGSDASHQQMGFALRRKLSEGRFIEGYLLEDGDWLDFRFTKLASIAPDVTLGIKYIQRF